MVSGPLRPDAVSYSPLDAPDDGHAKLADRLVRACGEGRAALVKSAAHAHDREQEYQHWVRKMQRKDLEVGLANTPLHGAKATSSGSMGPYGQSNMWSLLAPAGAPKLRSVASQGVYVDA